MSEVKHTPGPWYVAHNSAKRNAGAKTILADGDKWIGYAYGTRLGVDSIEQVEANAKLIAAAPDMYNAIKLALNIKDLWAPVNDTSIEHEGEAQALQAMLTALEVAIAKVTA